MTDGARSAPLRAVGDGLWVVEEGLSVLGVPAGRRSAVVALPAGGVLVHSPARLTPTLREALDGLGGVRAVVPASLLHGHLYMEDYAAAWPAARLHAAPGLGPRRPDLVFDGGVLGEEPEPAWAAVLDQALLRGHRLVTEVVFCHRPSRSLLVGDLVWHVTADMPPRGRLWGGWREGVRPTPAFRAGFRDRATARASLERILAWDFERIVVGHGAMVEHDGREVLRRAYGWVLR